MSAWRSSFFALFYSEDGKSYTLDPSLPENYWYNLTLHQTDKYNFNINYNPDLGQTSLWVNAPVFHTAPAGENKPIGMLGTAVDLTGFVNSLNQDMDPGVALYILRAAAGKL